MTRRTFSLPSLVAALRSFRPAPLHVLAAAAAILGCRRPDLFANPQFWAEDGSVFFLGARTDGLASLLSPSAGYYHTALRLVALLATGTDPLLAPAVYLGASLLLTLYVAALTLSPRFALAPSCGYALALALTPDAFEVLLNLTNLQWILALGLVAVLLLRDPATLAGRLRDATAAALLSVTGPFSILFAPLFLVRALLRRSLHAGLVAAFVCLGAAVQLVAIAAFPADPRTASLDAATLLSPLGNRVLGSLFAGGATAAAGPTTLGVLLALACFALLAFLLAHSAPGRLARTFVALAFLGVAAAALFRCRFFLPELNQIGFGARYFFPVQALFLWLVIDAAVSAPRPLAHLARALLVLALLVNLPRLREPALPDYNWPAAALRIRQGETVVVGINPEGWQFTVPGRAPSHSGVSPAPASASSPERTLANASARAFVTPDRPLIVGLAVPPGRPRAYYVRAIGPSLARLGVSDASAHPSFTLHPTGSSPSYAPLASRDAIDRLAQATGAFPLQPHSHEPAAILRLPPGTYSLALSVPETDSGQSLLEVYELPADFAAP